MTRLNNKFINWSLANKKLDGLYYDGDDINPVPACLDCSRRDVCNYSCINEYSEHSRSCFRFTRRHTKIDRINLYANECIYSWSEYINIFMRGRMK